MIRKINLTATIAAGATTATATSETIHGKIVSVEVNYPTNTCTVDLDTVGENHSQKIMDLAAANTDVTYYPQTPVCTNTGAETVYEFTALKKYTPINVFGKITLTLASGTATEAVTVGITYEE